MRKARAAVGSALVAGLTALTMLVGPAGPAAADATPQYYVALGASLVTGVGSTGGADYVNDLLAYAQPLVPSLQVENLGCGGETTSTMIEGGLCTKYTTGSQLGDAEAFIEDHPGQVAFVTLDIGADDVLGCTSGGVINTSCFKTGLSKVEGNLAQIVDGLRAASSTVPILGMTYYDPYLEFWLSGSSGQQQARKSVRLVQDLNNVLKKDYIAGDVTVASAYKQFDTGDFDDTGTWNGKQVPVNVETICNWTWMCTPGGPTIHANNTGYAELADAYEKVLVVPPTISGVPPSGAVGQSYSFAFTVGGIPAAKVHAKGQLPPGLALSSQGVLSGTPTEAGHFSFSVKVSNGEGGTVLAPETVTVTPAA